MRLAAMLMPMVTLVPMGMLVPGCVTSDPYKSVHQLASAKNCEAAARAMPTQAEEPGVGHQLADAVASGTSYTLTGAGYVLEGTIIFSAGVVGSVVICSPLLIFETAAKAPGKMSAKCIGHIGSGIVEAVDTDLGEVTYDSTAPMRERFDLTAMSKAMRSIAQCYENRDQPGDADKSLLQLNMIKTGLVYEYSTNQEQKAVDRQIAQLSRPKQTLVGTPPLQSPQTIKPSRGERDIARAKVVKRESELLQQEMTKTAEAARPHYWLDMKTGNTWRFVKHRVTRHHAEIVCDNVRDKVGQWHPPTTDELKLAVEHGMLDEAQNRAFRGLPRNLHFWLKDPAGFQIYIAGAIQAPPVNNDQFTLPHTFCVK